MGRGGLRLAKTAIVVLDGTFWPLVGCLGAVTIGHENLTFVDVVILDE